MQFFARFESFEALMKERLDRIEARIASNSEPADFFSEALKAYRGKVNAEFESEKKRSKLDRLSEIFRRDAMLRYPHRKILDFLLSQYDFRTESFKEVHFSRLVRESRIGKNMANTYLKPLEDKGYIERRSDGYRVFFKIKG